MNQKVKGIITGIVVGVLLSSGISIAKTTTTLYNVLTQGISIVVDGQKINPKDGAGNKVEPFIYNGTTYLPVRAVADAFKKEVSWDKDSYTVYLGKQPEKNVVEGDTVALNQLAPIGGNPSITTQAHLVRDEFKNEYDYAWMNSPGSYSAEYEVNGEYSRFKGVLYIPIQQSCNNSTTFSVIADGKEIYKSPAIILTSKPVDIDVDISGCKKVKLAFSNSYNLYHNVVCLGNAVFCK